MLSVRIIDEDIPIVVVEGKIDAANKKEINETIHLALNSRTLNPNINRLILDLTGVKTLDAGETQAIIDATHSLLGRGGSLALVVSKKDEEHALKEAEEAIVPGVLIFDSREKAKSYLGERGRGVA